MYIIVLFYVNETLEVVIFIVGANDSPNTSGISLHGSFHNTHISLLGAFHITKGLGPRHPRPLVTV